MILNNKFLSIYTFLFMVYILGCSGDIPNKSEVESSEANYIIITSDSFYNPDDENNPIIRFKKHKESVKGLTVKVVPLSEIKNRIAPTEQGINEVPSQIRAYLKASYENWTIKPEYLLLVGDQHIIPAYLYEDYFFKLLGLGMDILTDHYYGSLSYNHTNIYPYYKGKYHIPDISVGRLPAADIHSARIMIDKIINYETDTSNDEWKKRILLTGQFDDTGIMAFPTDINNIDPFKKIEKTVLDGKADKFFIKTSDQIFDYIKNETCMEIDNIYVIYADDILPSGYIPQYYMDGTKVPVDIQNELLSNENKSVNLEYISKINDGVLICAYRGHGLPEEPGSIVNQYDLINLSNKNKLPVFFNIGCYMNQFDYYYPCFGETLLAMEQGGGVGVIGGTRNSSSGYNDELYKGLFDAIWRSDGSTGTKKLGKILDYSKKYLYENYDRYYYSLLWENAIVESLLGVNYLMLYNTEITCLIGDPEMDIHVKLPEKIFYDDFEKKSFEKWTIEGNVTLYTYLNPNLSYNHCALMKKKSSLEAIINTYEYENIILKYKYRTYSLESNECCYIELWSLKNGGSWIVLDTIKKPFGTGAWYTGQIKLSPDTFNGQAIIRFRLDSSSVYDYVNIEDVSITGTPL